MKFRMFFAGMGFVAAAAWAQAPVVSFSSPAEVIARAALGSLDGAAVAAVWRNGKAEFAAATGSERVARPEVSGPNATLFEIGSISKVFTGLLLAQAVDAGDLTLDQTLGQLMAGKVEFASPHVAAITLGQLVTHTSCLPRLPPDFRKDYVRDEPYRSYDRARMWAAVGALKIQATPPCDASYSNLGMGLLGELLSQHYGKPWELLVRERITAPLGMNNTMQTLGDSVSRMAPAFSGDRRVPLWEMKAFAGAGALRSTPEDLLVLGRAILAGRAGPLGAAAQRLVTPLARFDGEIGYGIFVRGPAGLRTYSHTGGTGGYRSVIVLAPDTGEVMAVVASNAEAPVYRVSGDVHASRYPVEAGAVGLDPALLPGYAGVFRENGHNAWTFVAQDGRLYLRFTNQPFTELTPSGVDRFNIGTTGKAVFERQDGRVNAVTWTSRGAVHHALLASEPVPAAARLPDDTLKAYVGRYRAPRFDFVVTAANGQLSVQLTNQDVYRVYPVAGRADRFAWDAVQAEVEFERLGSGEVSALVLHQNGRVRAVRLD